VRIDGCLTFFEDCVPLAAMVSCDDTSVWKQLLNLLPGQI
jgi:hypothetical protein